MSPPPEASDGDDGVGEEPIAQHGGAQDGVSRAGERVLTLLATPLNLSILRALSERPMRLAELRGAAGLPAQTTLRGHLRMLGEVGALTRSSTKEAPHTVENELTPMGRELLDVADLLEGWLSRAPDRPIPLDSEAAKGIVKAFIEGWGSTIMGDLAARPMSLTELDSEISELSYPALERRLSSMRMAHLVEARRSQGTRVPYAVTEWARRGMVPLAAASRCERVHMGSAAAPVTQADIEAAFMLVTPLVGLEEKLSGSCRLEVEAIPGGLREPAGVEVTVRRGAVIACEAGFSSDPGDFAAGSTSGWFTAILEGRPELLRFGGGGRLAKGVVRGLHRALIAS
jgi:DNA-binding HxlR family transcriptional regulator